MGSSFGTPRRCREWCNGGVGLMRRYGRVSALSVYARWGVYERLSENLAKPPETAHLSPMPEITARLKTALADRYAIQEEFGAGGMAGVFLAEER